MEVGVGVGVSGVVGVGVDVSGVVGVGVDVAVVPPHAASSAATRSRLHKVSMAPPEMCFNRMSMIHFLLLTRHLASII